MDSSTNTSNRRSQVFLLCGMTGSGKTTFAKQLEYECSAVRFSIDEWMINLYDRHMSREDFDSRMNICKQLIWQTVERLIDLNIDVILDYGFWTIKERTNISSQIRHAGGIPVVYFFNVPSHILKQRLAIRNSQRLLNTFEITPEMLELFQTHFEPPSDKEGFEIIEIESSKG